MHSHSHDGNSHTHSDSFNNEDFMKYKSFTDGEKKHFYDIVSYDKRDIWKSLTIDKAKEMIENRQEYGLNDDQVKSLLIYSVMNYCVNNMFDPETMYIAEIITYELKKAGYLS